MKRGFKQFFTSSSHERTTRSGEEIEANGGEFDFEQQKRSGFFQKLFRHNGSRNTSPSASPHLLRKRGKLYDDEHERQTRSNERELNITTIDFKDKREMSVPVSPKSVKFEDEPSSLLWRGHSEAPQPSYDRSPFTTKQKYTIINGDPSLKTTKTTLSWRQQQEQSTSQVTRKDQISGVVSRDGAPLTGASEMALDEATIDLLRLSSLAPPTISYSGTMRLNPAADRLPKSASTSSMNKVIRTEDGGLLKLSNIFTWDAARLGEKPNVRETSPVTSSYLDSDRRKHQTILVYNEENKERKPVVQTTVEGKLNMEKVVGSDLISCDQCFTSGWTIRDTVTHYKVKTKLGNRMIIMEERKITNGDENGKDFKMSVYENNVLKTEQNADIQIPKKYE